MKANSFRSPIPFRSHQMFVVDSGACDAQTSLEEGGSPCREQTHWAWGQARTPQCHPGPGCRLAASPWLAPLPLQWRASSFPLHFPDVSDQPTNSQNPSVQNQMLLVKHQLCHMKIKNTNIEEPFSEYKAAGFLSRFLEFLLQLLQTKETNEDDWAKESVSTVSSLLCLSWPTRFLVQ